jgi:hypothetical protein
MSREIPDLRFLDGMAFLAMGLRQNPLSAVALEASTKQLDPAQQEELLDALSMWQRVARETGAFYTKGDALRLPDHNPRMRRRHILGCLCAHAAFLSLFRSGLVSEVRE